MCYFKNLEKIDTINEIQTIIVRTISRKKENFNYQNIITEIKNVLKELGVPESITESYRIDNMVNDTLEQMIDMGNLSNFNNIYIPRKRSVKKIRYAFS